MKRKEARAQVLSLLFETGFRNGETPAEIYAKAVEIRDMEENDYIRDTYFGIMDNLGFTDEKIAAFSRGWKTTRISPVSRAIMRLAIYEMYFRDDVPDNVAVNEAVELVKVYDDADKVKAFVNGILNSVLQEKRAGGAE